ncbi:TIGR04211 family SH3 domain-containing protein [Chromatiaceae bacterium AAb-1]|nr:TIGR04211 family SH3 domain-containing protein [Chromatiaceae bacterium AAb-1]
MFRLFKSSLAVLFLLPALAIAQSSEQKAAFISDALFVYLHSGPSNQYRIIGTVNAGQEVTYLSEDATSGYAQIRYDNNKTGWLPKEYVTYTPGLVSQLENLKSDFTAQQNRVRQLEQERDQLQSRLNNIQAEHQQTQEQLNLVNLTNGQLKAQVAATQSSVWQNPMVLGSCILAAGLLLGLLLPLLWPKRRGGGDRWM